MEKIAKAKISSLAGTMFLLEVLWSLYVFLRLQNGLSLFSALGIELIAGALMCIALFKGKQGSQVRTGLALFSLGGLLELLMRIVSLLSGWDNYYSMLVIVRDIPLTILEWILPPLALFLLTDEKRRDKMKKYWMVPGFFFGILLSVGMLYNGLAHNSEGSPFQVGSTLRIYGYLLIGYWYSHPEMTVGGLVERYTSRERIETNLDLYLWGVARSMAVCSIFVALTVVLLIKDPFRNAFMFLFIAFVVPWTICPLLMGLMAAPKANAQARRMRNSVNQVKAWGGDEYAKAELRKEAGRQAKKEVIKNAVIGSVIAGDAGAVIGAVSTKAKQDAMSDMPTGSILDRQERTAAGKKARNEVIKHGVVGGVIAGDVGAAVGAVSAKAKQDAEKKK